MAEKKEKTYRGDTRTRAHRIRAVRQEELRQKLAAQGHEQHILDCAEKIGNVDPQESHADVEVRKWKAKAEIHAKLLDKYIPALKAVEMEVDASEALTERLTAALHHVRNRNA
jgi:hypothetical protein